MSTLATTNLKHASSGSNNVVLASDGTTTITAPSNIIKSGTAVASTSGTAIDFTGIPSWAKRVTVIFNGVSTNGASNWVIRLGSGSITATGYTSLGSNYTATPVINQNSETTGFLIVAGASTVVVVGALKFHLLSGNTWVGDGLFARTDAAITNASVGAVTLSATLDRIRITTVNGTDTFDAGTINLLWEG